MPLALLNLMAFVFVVFFGHFIFWSIKTNETTLTVRPDTVRLAYSDIENVNGKK